MLNKRIEDTTTTTMMMMSRRSQHLHQQHDHSLPSSQATSMTISHPNNNYNKLSKDMKSTPGRCGGSSRIWMPVSFFAICCMVVLRQMDLTRTAMMTIRSRSLPLQHQKFLDRTQDSPFRSPSVDVENKFLSGKWLAEGLRLDRIGNYRHDSGRYKEFGDRENSWVPKGKEEGSEFHLLKSPLGLDGFPGEGEARASPACANVNQIRTKYLDEFHLPWTHTILFEPMLCVDIDMTSKSPLVISSPSFSGKYRSNEPYLDELLYPRGYESALAWLLRAVLPLMPSDAKGSFVIVLGDMQSTQAPKVDLQRLFYENGTPFMLHAFSEYTDLIGMLPEYDTMASFYCGDKKIREIIFNNIKNPLPWHKKENKILFRSSANGYHDGYEHFTKKELAFWMNAESHDPKLVDKLISCGHIQRMELAIWANSKLNQLRDVLDVQITGRFQERPDPEYDGVCQNISARMIGIPGPEEVQNVPDTSWDWSKGIFVIDGFGAPFSFRSKLALNTVVLKMDSPLKQEFERFILPGVHYVPFNLNNVTEVVKYVLAEENAEEMQAIVKQAHATMAEKMGQEHVAQRVRDDLLRLWRWNGKDNTTTGF